jgi:hypothetical protein
MHADTALKECTHAYCLLWELSVYIEGGKIPHHIQNNATYPRLKYFTLFNKFSAGNLEDVV